MKDDEILTLLEQLLKMAETGAHFSKDDYNRERYRSIREKTELLYSAVPSFKKMLIEPYDDIAYITPKVGVNAYIENKMGEVLLERRADDSCWAIPGGWAEPGLTAEENIIREIKEETGLNVKIIKLLDVISRKPSARYLFSSYHIIFKCEIISGDIKKSHESEEVSWKKADEVNPWHFDHKNWMDRIRNTEKFSRD